MAAGGCCGGVRLNGKDAGAEAPVAVNVIGGTTKGV